MSKVLYDKLTAGILSDAQVEMLLNWQLTLRAEEIDCALVEECLLYLDRDASGINEKKKMEIWGSLFERVSAQRRRAKMMHTHHRRNKVLVVAALMLLLLALAMSAVAYMYTRGVLNFNDDFGFGTMVTGQEGAEELVVSGALAHLEREHVIIDVLEAACDGTELRIVYRVTSKVGECYIGEHSADSYIVPGMEEDVVHMCDFVQVNGEDAYFYDTYEVLDENPNAVLYYLQSTLLDWGVDVSGADTLEIGLPCLGVPEYGKEREMLRFTIPATIEPEMIRGAEMTGAYAGGYNVTMQLARFTPLSGYVQFFIEGVQRETLWEIAEGWGWAVDAQGEKIPGGRLEGCDKAENGTELSFFIMPPRDGWMEEIRYVYQMQDGDDWTFDIRLDKPAQE